MSLMPLMRHFNVVLTILCCVNCTCCVWTNDSPEPSKASKNSKSDEDIENSDAAKITVYHRITNNISASITNDSPIISSITQIVFKSIKTVAVILSMFNSLSKMNITCLSSRNKDLYLIITVNLWP